MKLKHSQNDLTIIHAILDHTSRSKTEIASILYTLTVDAFKETIKLRDEIIKSYEEKVTKPNPALDHEQLSKKEKDGLPKEITVTEVPQAKVPEVNKKIDAIEVEVKRPDMAIPGLKLAIENFPKTVVDNQTGQKWLRWHKDIETYNRIKKQFKID